MQTAPPAVADSRTLAGRTNARQCIASWCSFEIFESYLELLVHGVVVKLLMAPTAERVVVPLKGFEHKKSRAPR